MYEMENNKKNIIQNEAKYKIIYIFTSHKKLVCYFRNSCNDLLIHIVIKISFIRSISPLVLTIMIIVLFLFSATCE